MDPRDFVRAEVRRNEDLGAQCHLLELQVPESFPTATVRAGQFVMLRGPWDTHPMLPRAFSILEAMPGRLRLLNKVVGRGTRRVASLTEGEWVTVLGPLGTPFPAPRPGVPQILVGGGSGIPPLYLQARQARQADPQAAVEILYGGRTAADLVLLSRVESLGVPVQACTDDGSRGVKGQVTAALQPRLDALPEAEVLACGPLPMLRAIQTQCRTRGHRCLISLETEMACGVGICRGCMVRRADGEGYLCTCLDGPVVLGQEVEL